VIAGIFFSGLNLLWLGCGVLVLGLLLVVWGYRNAGAGWVSWVCATLKLLALGCLVICFLEPLWSGQRARPGANQFAILADNSQGLQVKDRGATTTRGDHLRGLLDTRHANWQRSLEENFDVRRYLFDTRLQTSRDFGELNFQGRATALGAALRTVADRYRGRPLAGVLLLTDGNATDLRGDFDPAGLPPIYPVVIGSSDPIQDIALQEVRTTQTDFEDAPVSIQAEATVNGYSGETIVARILDTAGKVISTQTSRARQPADRLAFRFQFKPEKPGLSFYRLSLRAQSEISANEAQKTAEATLANNATVFVVERGRGPYRILYVAGRPNWEFKFLNRALEEDKQLDLVALIRVAKREPKFNFLGRAGETSNPLFRGFGNQSAEEVERYDQPVLVRLNPRDELEMRTGFPRTPEQLYGFHAVIIGDLEAEFFSPDQAALVQRFVSERGGGFLMLGGMESFRQGKYEHTPVGDMLPVYLDREDGLPPPGPYRFDLTREGLLQSWARLRDNEADERARLQSMTPFQVLNPIREVKPGASTIARVVDAKGQAHPALVVQRFGRGRTAALAIGDVWRWGMHDPDSHRDMDKAWRQLARWLVADVPNRVELSVEPAPNESNGSMRIQVRVRDEKFQPLDNAAVTLQVEPVLATEAPGLSTNAVRLQPEPASAEAGLYQAVYVPHLTGGYRASVSVTNSEGVQVGTAVAGWSTDLAAEEFRSLTPNVGLLEAIAGRTGGKVIVARNLDQFARDLPHRAAPVMEPWTRPLWHTPAMFALAIALLASEWGLRRWKGLP
jgi:uncharacterized membrane protein